ncbi:MAG TPA: FAD-binding protein, partial [Sphaerochaeta sp.]|nr:FAD-binding protein [Sphaerochaeta sp.]
YQQVIPSYFSTDSEGNDRQEFLQPFFSSTESLCNAIFLKGYQWPFDVNKILDEGSSLIDILVYRERVLLGRRVYMDFRVNPQAVSGSAPFSLMGAGEVAYSYLEKSGALGETPYERLKQMNPQAIELYRSNGIDLANEPLEVAVCSQHNNGGLSVDIWWESTNISHLFPVGEVAGTHGVVRPGGSALNSGQVGGERAAQKIAGVYQEHTVEWETFMAVAKSQASKLYALAKAAIKKESLSDEDLSLVAYQKEFRSRMSRSGSMIRSTERIADELIAAQEQVAAFEQVRIKTRYSLPRFFAARHLALTHLVYLEAIAEYLKQAFGSRGSALILQEDGKAIHPKLDSFWRFTPENTEGRAESITTIYQGGESMHGRVACRPIPDEEYWFETVWRDFLAGKHFNDYGEKAQKS